MKRRDCIGKGERRRTVSVPRISQAIDVDVVGFFLTAQFGISLSVCSWAAESDARARRAAETESFMFANSVCIEWKSTGIKTKVGRHEGKVQGADALYIL